MFPGLDTILSLRYLAGDLYSLSWQIIKYNQFFNLNLIKHGSNISKSLDCYERHTIPVRDILLHFPLGRGGSFCRTGYSESMKTVTIKLFAARLVKTKDWNTPITGLTLLWLHLRKSCCFQQYLGSSLFLLAYLCICAFTCTKKAIQLINFCHSI